MKRVLNIYPFLIVILSIGNLAAQTVPAAYNSNIKINFIRTWDAAKPEANVNNITIASPIEEFKMTTQYFDGLGRPFQTVVKQGSLTTATGANVDMISPVVYDKFGREQYKYLPFASTATDATKDNGLFKLDPFQQQASFYSSADASKNPIAGQGETFFYNQIKVEPSPLNRVQESFAPGNSWAGTSAQVAEANRKSVKAKYFYNRIADSVRIWNVTNGAAGTLGTYSSPAGAAGIYTAGQLHKTITVDEKNNQVIEFKDKEGKIVLKKVQLTATADNGTGNGHTGWLCTYYIYDDLNNLRCVIQPKGVELISSNWLLTNTTILAEQCFRYAYDERARMIMKKVPGAGDVYMVYDARDRLIMVQDALMRAAGKWMVTLYDELNRPTQTGLLLNTYFGTTAKTFIQHLADATIVSNGTYPFDPATPPTSTHWEELTATFYDNYDWLAANGNPFSSNRYAGNDYVFLAASNTTYPYPQAPTQSFATRGLVTGTKTKVLATTNSYLYGITYYDEKGRILQTQKNNVTNCADIISFQYSYSGQVLVKNEEANKCGSPNQHSWTTTKYEYDDLGRLVTVKKQVNNPTVAVPEKVIVQKEYDALGQLKKKKLAPAHNSNAGLETLDYNYNIRGWMLGMNRDYLATEGQTGDGKHFGFELGYDKLTNKTPESFNTAQWNGNINGMIWKSDGDDIRRKYDFTYDPVNRLLKADFEQQNADDHAWNNSQVNYTVQMGDGATGASAYDANGNIKAMTQYGFKLGGNPQTPIDQLTYNYTANTNKLLNVIDAQNDTTTKLGDFRTSALHPTQSKIATTIDYTYDVNGNMLKDLNKDLGKSNANGIVYNHLNLPRVVTMYKTGGVVKGTITYTYDAAGNKLRKVVLENNVSIPGTSYISNITTTTTYIEGAVYESKDYSHTSLGSLDYTDRLQFIGHEEGRIRWGHDNNTFNYDYFLKDHLGNVRMVLTEEQQQNKYPVGSLETTKLNIEDDYYSIDQSKIVDANTVTGLPVYTNDNGIGNNPTDVPFETANSAKLYKLNSTTNKTGLGITLKVMSGDRIDIHGKSYYFQNNTGGTAANSAISVLDILNGLLGGPTGGVAAGAHGGVTGTQLNGYPGTTNGINTLLIDQTINSNAAPQLPKAYINYIFFDEQFKSVATGFSKVGTNSAIKNHFSELQNLTAPKNGYVYIYVSNESPVNVFFDNLQVVHTRGPILEETNYYPFGLVMQGISSKALLFGNPQNKYKFNSGTELNSDFDISFYETECRLYDPQIGRFLQVDELAESNWEWSPYAFALNNPILFNDPLGLDPEKSDPNNPKALPEVVVIAIPDGHWAKQRLYYEIMDQLKRRGATIDQILQPSLQEMMYRYDGITKHRERVSEMTRESDEVVLEAASLFIPMSWIAKVKYLKYAAKLFRWKRGKTTVYISKAADGTVQYVGITDDLARRAAEHLTQKGIDIVPLMTKLTRSEARAVEQVLIEMHGLMKNSGTLLNKINSIAKTNPDYAKQLTVGLDKLMSIGYVP